MFILSLRTDMLRSFLFKLSSVLFCICVLSPPHNVPWTFSPDFCSTLIHLSIEVFLWLLQLSHRLFFFSGLPACYFLILTLACDLVFIDFSRCLLLPACVTTPITDLLIYRLLLINRTQILHTLHHTVEVCLTFCPLVMSGGIL